jgi:hypothetical protein
MAYQPQPVREQAEGEAAGLTLCPNCRAAMPGQMRFCRLCGYRLGEGVAEYAETVRLAAQPAGPQRVATAERRDYATASRFYGTQGGALAQGTAGVVHKTNALARGASCAGKGKWPHWIIWPILAIFLSVLSEVDQRLHKNSQPKARPAAVKTGTDIPPPPAPPEIAERVVIGPEQLKDAAGGASLEFVTPGSAADKAGLRSGDIVVALDGLPIRTRSDFESRLGRALPGSTVRLTIVRGAGERLEIPVRVGQEQ